MSEMRVVPVDTITGVPIVNEVRAVSGDWTRTLGQPGAGKFELDVSALSAAEVRRIARGWGTTLVVEWMGGVPVAGRAEWAGLVQSVDWDGRTLSVQARELPCVLTRRLLWGIGAQPPTRDLRGDSLGSILRQLVWLALYNGDARWRLPVLIPEARTGGVRRVFEWWRFQTAADAIASVADEDAAPLWDLRPEWFSGRLVWRMLTGDLDGGVVDVPVSTPADRIAGGATVTVTRDWAQQLTGCFAIGEGQEADIRWGEAGSGPEGPGSLPVAPDIPWLDSAVAWVEVDSPARLQALAKGRLRQQRYGVDQWTVEVTGDDDVPPYLYRPGTKLRLLHPGDALVDAGTRTLTVVEVAGDLSLRRRLKVQGV